MQNPVFGELIQIIRDFLSMIKFKRELEDKFKDLNDPGNCKLYFFSGRVEKPIKFLKILAKKELFEDAC